MLNEETGLCVAIPVNARMNDPEKGLVLEDCKDDDKDERKFQKWKLKDKDWVDIKAATR